ncbi:MAG TPA: metallophosphoesterase [Chloroflexota bacterium]
MTIWAIGDLHSSPPDPSTGQPTKPMDAFGPRWVAHIDRLEETWAGTVEERDTVILAGDLDWALHFQDALPTLERVASWKGRKLLVRGNHDYWWSSKTTNRVRRHLPEGLELLHNNAFVVEGMNVCGTKGSPVPGGIDWTPEHEKLLHRELQRLRLSLAERDPTLPTIVALHYPPFYVAFRTSPFKQLLEETGVDVCVYGHLHGEAAALGPNGRYDSIEYRLVAGDFLDFRPLAVAQHGTVLSAT